MIEKDIILRNHKGEWLQVCVTKIADGKTSEPVITTESQVKLASFAQATKETDFAFCGDLFCWTEDHKVIMHNIATNSRK